MYRLSNLVLANCFREIKCYSKILKDYLRNCYILVIQNPDQVQMFPQIFHNSEGGIGGNFKYTCV